MSQHKTVVTPLLTQWSYHSLALSYLYMNLQYGIQAQHDTSLWVVTSLSSPARRTTISQNLCVRSEPGMSNKWTLLGPKINKILTAVLTHCVLYQISHSLHQGHTWYAPIRLSRHDGNRWPGANLTPVHEQLPCWLDCDRYQLNHIPHAYVNRYQT